MADSEHEAGEEDNDDSGGPKVRQALSFKVGDAAQEAWLDKKIEQQLIAVAETRWRTFAMLATSTVGAVVGALVALLSTNSIIESATEDKLEQMTDKVGAATIEAQVKLTAAERSIEETKAAQKDVDRVKKQAEQTLAEVDTMRSDVDEVLEMVRSNAEKLSAEIRSQSDAFEVAQERLGQLTTALSKLDKKGTSLKKNIEQLEDLAKTSEAKQKNGRVRVVILYGDGDKEVARATVESLADKGYVAWSMASSDREQSRILYLKNSPVSGAQLAEIEKFAEEAGATFPDDPSFRLSVSLDSHVQVQL